MTGSDVGVGSDRGALPAFRLVGFPGPSEPDVQLGCIRLSMCSYHWWFSLCLHHTHPPLGLWEVGPRCAGIHQRPPRSTVRLRTHWTPSPCDRISRSRTTAGPPPHPTGISRQQAFPPTAKIPAGEGTGRMVPTFGLQPFDRVGAQLCSPSIATATPQAHTMASRPATSTDQSVTPHSNTVRVCAATRPQSTRFEPLGISRSFRTLVPHVRLSVLLAGPGPIWRYWSIPSLSGLLSTLTVLFQRLRLSSASTCTLRRARGGDLPPPHG